MQHGKPDLKTKVCEYEQQTDKDDVKIQRQRANWDLGGLDMTEALFMLR